MDFGKYVGKTYGDVFHSHRSYCDWVVKTSTVGDSPSHQLQRFAQYILAKREIRGVTHQDPDAEPSGLFPHQVQQETEYPWTDVEDDEAMGCVTSGAEDL